MISPAELVRIRGGSYATALGIDLASPDTNERFKWFLAAMLYGARISELLATRTWREFSARRVLTPQRMLDCGWDELVAILDAGGYTRYDYKTATKLLAVCDALQRDYNGSLDVLHAAATDPRDLEASSKRWARESATRRLRYSCASCAASGARQHRRCRRWR